MTDRTDIDLLREYARAGAEDAFTAVVARHLGMVYHAALRQTRAPELAEEVAQTVFALLARKAGSLAPGTIIGGWLFKTTRFVAARAVRDEYRRRRREEEAASMNLNTPNETQDPMERALPILDEMLSRLRQPDREALLVRYFEGKSFATMAQTLGASEDAAKKRVQRALEKLRQLLAACGVAVTTGTLAAGLQVTGLQAAPAGLAAIVSSAALHQAAGATALTLLTQTTLKVMALTKIKILATAAVVLVVVGGTVAYISQPSSAPPAPVTQQEESNRRKDQDQIARLEAENRRLTAALAQANSEKQQLEVTKQDAEESAKRYHELVEKSKAENPSPLEVYPTPRHALVGFGKLLVLPKKAMNFGRLSPEEQKIAAAEMLVDAQEGSRVAEAMKELKMDKSWMQKQRTPAEAADLFTCFLHGALNLNEQQYGQVAVLLKTHYQTAGAKPLDLDDMASASASGTRAPTDGLDPKTLQQIENLLSPKQKATFQQFTKVTN